MTQRHKPIEGTTVRTFERKRLAERSVVPKQGFLLEVWGVGEGRPAPGAPPRARRRSARAILGVMRRLLLAAISAVLTYLVVVTSYDVVLAGRDPFWYFAYFLTLFIAINSGLGRLPDRRTSGDSRAL